MGGIVRGKVREDRTICGKTGRKMGGIVRGKVGEIDSEREECKGGE